MLEHGKQIKTLDAILRFHIPFTVDNKMRVFLLSRKFSKNSYAVGICKNRLANSPQLGDVILINTPFSPTD